VFPVSPEKARALRARMERLAVREEDLEERFIRSRGKGGQNVNKVSTCVVLRHVPTGIAVRLDRLEARERGAAATALQERERIRRQKRRRSRRAREKMLANKRAQGEKKTARRPSLADYEG